MGGKIGRAECYLHKGGGHGKEGKGRDQSIERGSVQDEKKRAEDRDFGNTSKCARKRGCHHI